MRLPWLTPLRSRRLRLITLRAPDRDRILRPQTRRAEDGAPWADPFGPGRSRPRAGLRSMLRSSLGDLSRGGRSPQIWHGQHGEVPDDQRRGNEVENSDQAYAVRDDPADERHQCREQRLGGEERAHRRALILTGHDPNRPPEDRGAHRVDEESYQRERGHKRGAEVECGK